LTGFGSMVRIASFFPNGYGSITEIGLKFSF
jgi:hypothetical protein